MPQILCIWYCWTTILILSQLKPNVIIWLNWNIPDCLHYECVTTAFYLYNCMSAAAAATYCRQPVSSHLLYNMFISLLTTPYSPVGGGGHQKYRAMVIDREAREIIRLVASVHLFVCLRSNFWTFWHMTLIFGISLLTRPLRPSLHVLVGLSALGKECLQFSWFYA